MVLVINKVFDTTELLLFMDTARDHKDALQPPYAVHLLFLISSYLLAIRGETIFAFQALPYLHIHTNPY